jgi:RHS repeat-associated protein
MTPGVTQPLVQTATCIVNDDVFVDPAGNSTNPIWANWTLTSVKNSVQLKLNHAKLKDCPYASWSCTAQVIISRNDKNGNALPILTQNLVVNYNNATGVTYKDIDIIDFEESHWMSIFVNTLSFSPNMPNPLSDYVSIIGTIDIERYHLLDFNAIPTFSTIQLLSGSGEIELSWSPVDGAEAYDLEYVYVDNYDTFPVNNSGIGIKYSEQPINLLDVSFRHNATRITTPNLSLSMSPLFERGYVLYRVRALGRALDNTDQTVHGAWSNSNYGQTVNTYTLNKDRIYISDNYYAGSQVYEHQPNFNWQFSVSFAEEGNKKEVVQYMDGSYRHRQSATRNSTDQMALVGESVYDFLGRPTINFIPVPAFDNLIDYHPNFNQNQAGQPYSAADFDLSQTCVRNVNPASTSSGAAKYYSSANPKAGDIGYQYIPQAQWFPFSVTELMPDNTGRVRRQGGIGATHQLGNGSGSSHETQYFYGRPAQEELDRLFGNSVGKANHYEKNMVIDPNGQISVSYLDLQGRTIATSLAGQGASNLQNVSTQTSPTTLDINLLDLQYLDGIDFASSVDRKHTVALAGDHVFSYSLNVPRFSTAGSPSFCYDCVYDLEFSVINSCGEEMLDGDPNTPGNQAIRRAIGQAQVYENVDCNSPQKTYAFISDPELANQNVTVNLPIGDYTIHKRLVPNQEAAEAYTQHYMANNLSLKSITDFENNYLANINYDNCTYTCQQCLQDLGTQEDFLTEQIALLENPPTAEDITYINNLWLSKQSLCDEICVETQSDCDFYLKRLKEDVSPGGQYARFLEDGTLGDLLNPAAHSGVLQFSYKYYKEGSTYYPINYVYPNGDPILVLHNGKMVSPADLEPTDFVNLFDESWANALVLHHPEYCQYLRCTTNMVSSNYDMDMRNTLTYAAAKTKGLLNPLGMSAIPFSGTLAQQDPFFVSGGMGAAHKSDFTTALDDYKLLWGGKACQKNVSLWELCYLIQACSTDFDDCNNSVDCRNNAGAMDWDALACAPYQDLMWTMFKSAYLQKKADFVKLINPSNCSRSSSMLEKETVFKTFEDIKAMQDFDNPSKLSIKTNALNNIYLECDENCLAFADLWMNKLTNCNLNAADSASLREEFINICRNGCDAENPFGASSIKPPNGLNRTPLNVYSSFETAFNAYSAQGKLAKQIGVCDINLLDFPEYGHTYSPYDDTAECTTYANPGDDCIKNGSASPEVKKALAAATEKDTGTCRRCVDCFKVKDAVDDLYTYYATSINTNIYENTIAIQNYLNTKLNLNLNFGDYQDFIRKCLEDEVSPDSALFFIMKNKVQLGTLTSNENPFSAINAENYASAEPINENQEILFGGNTPKDYSPFRNHFADINSAPPNANMPNLIELKSCHCDWIQTQWLNYSQLNPPSPMPFNDYMSNDCWEVGNPDPAYDFEALRQNCQKAYNTDKTNLSPPLGMGGTWSTTQKAVLEGLKYGKKLFVPECTPCAGPPDPNGHNPDFNRLFPPNNGGGGGSNGGGNNPVQYNVPCDSFMNWMDSWATANGLTNDIKSAMFKQGQGDNLSPGEIADLTQLKNAFYTAFPYSSKDPLFTDPVKQLKDFLMRYVSCFKHTYDAQYNGCCYKLSPYGLALKDLLNKYCQQKPGDDFNYFAYNGWSLHPVMPEYYNTILYNGTCSTALTNEVVEPTLGRLWFNIKDNCGNTSLVKLKYLNNHNNQMFYGNLVSIDSIYPWALEPCDTTSSFRLVATQLDWLGNPITVDITGSSKYPIVDTCTPMFNNYKLCDKFLDEYLPEVLDCEEILQMQAKFSAKLAYESYIDSVYRNIKNEYLHKCAEAAAGENGRMQYELQEYHFTLYYYDQANNLIQTVPPSGVNPLSTGSLNAVQNHRNNNTGFSAVYPTHTLPTRYMFNTLNQLTWQKTPDGGESEFWYDNVGRLVVSQNAKQKPAGKYAYTTFDALGRIKEVGGAQGPLNNMTTAVAFDPVALDNFITSRTRNEVTRTQYDEAYAHLTVTNFSQDNLRSRVASMVFEQDYDANDATYDYGIHYTYDEHGVVPTVLRENQKLANTVYASMQYKRMDYGFDLHSGKINDFSYQKGEADQYLHRYSYDADLRLTDVYSGPVKGVLDHEAEYYYYLHGPLRRTELGQLKVQGTDYAYTMQGWLKGVNSGTLQADRDIGRDGLLGSQNEMVARDVYGFSLEYFAGDYTPIDMYGGLNQLNYFMPENSSINGFNQASPDLFNGNIKAMVTAIKPFMGPNNVPQGMAYEYDQLNRLVHAEAWNNVVTGGNYWPSGGSKLAEYESNYTYDGNGNIMTLGRVSKTPAGLAAPMDALTYHYKPNTNQLEYVDDGVAGVTFDNDIDDQAAGNYVYDAIGNLIKDVAEEIDVIEWTLSGKIKAVIRTPISTKPDLQFEYDPMGNRVLKRVISKGPGATVKELLYIRDASGNEMATYSMSGDSLTWKSSSIYGSSRVGVYDANKLLEVGGQSIAPTTTVHITRGLRKYELSNHLGNVLVVVSDKRTSVCDPNMQVTHYEADIVMAQDFHPFGSVMNGRSWSNENYRFGFNGKELQVELGDVYDYNARISDNRLGRWFSLDPIINSSWSGYTLLKNSPICMVDPSGETDFYNLDGNWIGTDGDKTNLSIIVVTNDKVERLINKQSKRGNNYKSELPNESFYTLPSSEVNKATIKVFEMMQSDVNEIPNSGGAHEASTAFDLEGKNLGFINSSDIVTQVDANNQILNGVEAHIGVDINIEKGKFGSIGIHAHPTVIFEVLTVGGYKPVEFSVFEPSELDKASNQNFNLNIIVGNDVSTLKDEVIRQPDGQFTNKETRVPGDSYAAYYDKDTNLKFSIKMNALKAIEDGSGKSESKAFKKYNNKNEEH